MHVARVSIHMDPDMSRLCPRHLSCARYREKYGRRQWHLCETAFCVVVERAAKYAREDGRKLRVMPECSSQDDERRIEAYFDSLKQNGAPFDRQSSSLYAPLSSEQLRDTLYEVNDVGVCRCHASLG